MAKISVNSTNPIVNMALNRKAVARNADIDSLIREINKHGELAAQKEGANIYVDVLSKTGNETVGSFIERKVGRGVWQQLKPVRMDDAGNCATFAVKNAEAAPVANATWNTTKLTNDVFHAIMALRNELTSELNVAIKAKASDKDEYDCHTQILGYDWIEWLKSRSKDLDAASRALSKF